MIHTARVTEFYPGGGHDRVEIIVGGDDACVLAIADGMGGRSGAAAAAEFWITAVRNQAADQDAWSDAKFWLRVMADADRVIRDAAHAGETTAVVAAISGARRTTTSPARRFESLGSVPAWQCQSHSITRGALMAHSCSRPMGC